MRAATGSTFRDDPQFSSWAHDRGASVIRSTVRSVAMSAVARVRRSLARASIRASLSGRSRQSRLVDSPEPAQARDRHGPGHRTRPRMPRDSPAVAPAPAGAAGANVVGPVQIIENSEIERSTAKSVTELLAQNAVGFMSEWTPGQTSINIRGAATDGQGARLQEPGAGADQRSPRRHRQSSPRCRSPTSTASRSCVARPRSSTAARTWAA